MIIKLVVDSEGNRQKQIQAIAPNAPYPHLFFRS